MSKNNPDIFNLATPYVDGELSDDDAERVRRHAQENPLFQAHLEAEDATKRLLANRLTPTTAPDQLKQEIRAAVFSETSRHEHIRWPIWSIVVGRPAVATATGSIVFLLVLTTTIVLFAGERVTPYVTDIYAHHTEGAEYPIQFAFNGSHEDVATNTEQAVGFPVVVPRFGEGLDPVGSRSCTLCNHPIAFIKYQGTEGAVSFFIIPQVRPALWRLDQATCDTMTFHLARYHDVHMAFWSHAGITYCLAASVEDDRLVNLSARACLQVRARIEFTDRSFTHPVCHAQRHDLAWLGKFD